MAFRNPADCHGWLLLALQHGSLAERLFHWALAPLGMPDGIMRFNFSRLRRPECDAWLGLVSHRII